MRLVLPRERWVVGSTKKFKFLEIEKNQIPRREMEEEDVIENSDSEDILDLGETSDSLSSVHEISEDEEELEKKENISIEEEEEDGKSKENICNGKQEEEKGKESEKRVKFTVEEKMKQKVGIGHSNEEEKIEGLVRKPKEGVFDNEEKIEGFGFDKRSKNGVSNDEEGNINEGLATNLKKGERNLRKLQGFQIPKKGDFDCSFQMKELMEMKRNFDDVVEFNGGEGGNSYGCNKKNCGCHYNNWDKHCDEENAHYNMNKFRYLFSDDNPNSLCHVM